jgi:hypothetical protein
MKAKRIKVKKAVDSEDDNVSESGSVNDEEFDAYLDSLGAAGGKNDADDDIDDDLDFMGEVGKPATKKRKHASDDEESGQDDWDMSDNEGSENPEKKKLKFDLDEEISDDGSISLDDENEIMGSSDSDDDASVIMEESDDDTESETDEDQPKTKKKNLSVAAKLKKKLKSDDMDSLFVGTDEFAEMLEASAKSKHHGTSDDIRNQDRSSDKQMKWESGRMQDLAELKKRTLNPHKSGARQPGVRPFEKRDGGGRIFGKKPGFKKSFKPGSKTKKFKQAKFNKPTRR